MRRTLAKVARPALLVIVFLGLLAWGALALYLGGLQSTLWAAALAAAGLVAAVAAVLPMHSCVGRKLDGGFFFGLRLARPGGQAAAVDGELCPPPEPVLRPAPLRRPPWQMAAPGSIGECNLRSGWGLCNPEGCTWMHDHGRARSLRYLEVLDDLRRTNGLSA